MRKIDGEKIRERRDQLNRTQAQAAAIGGITEKTLRDYENGKAQFPQPATLEALARSIDVDLPLFRSEYVIDDSVPAYVQQHDRLGLIPMKRPSAQLVIDALANLDEKGLAEVARALPPEVWPEQPKEAAGKSPSPLLHNYQVDAILQAKTRTELEATVKVILADLKKRK